MSKEEWIAKRRERWSEAFALVERGEARPRVTECVRLVEAGLNLEQIGRALGVGRSTVQSYLSDPTGELSRARKAKRNGVCVDCGVPTKASGELVAPKRCDPCYRRDRTFRAKEKVIEGIQDWVRRYGAIPSAQDWNVAQMGLRAHPERLALTRQRHRDRKWPHLSSVQAQFGSWNNAVKAAGFEPVPPGQRHDVAAWKRHQKDGYDRRKERGMGPAIDIEQVIEREMEKIEARREKLREELARVEVDAQRVKRAFLAIQQEDGKDA